MSKEEYEEQKVLLEEEMSIQKSEGDAAAKEGVNPFKKTSEPPPMLKKLGANTVNTVQPLRDANNKII